jgi:hypothetical protein
LLLPEAVMCKHRLEASTSLTYELMLARSDGISGVAMSRTISEFFRKIFVLPPPSPPVLGRRTRSGARASRIDADMRSDFADILILAL